MQRKKLQRLLEKFLRVPRSRRGDGSLSAQPRTPNCPRPRGPGGPFYRSGGARLRACGRAAQEKPCPGRRRLSRPDRSEPAAGKTLNFNGVWGLEPLGAGEREGISAGGDSFSPVTPKSQSTTLETRESGELLTRQANPRRSYRSQSQLRV